MSNLMNYYLNMKNYKSKFKNLNKNILKKNNLINKLYFHKG